MAKEESTVPGPECALGIRSRGHHDPGPCLPGRSRRLVPEAWGRELVRRIPGATITCYPGEGHFIALTRRRDVLESLR